jgi:adenylate cyclase
MRERILIVEDAPANIQALKSILGEQGYQVSAVTSGHQAISVLDRVRPDLILLDVMMPEMDGFETCRRIKSSTTWREIPLVFLTSKIESIDIVRGFELGAVDYVVKPFNAPELLARVGNHLALDRLHRENQRLLLNVLPATIAAKLKSNIGIIADGFDDVSVLFADLVGFTSLSARLSPTALIVLLNRVFSSFDELVEANNVEKIKTIGDAYMVAGGLTEPHPDHLASMGTMALAMLDRVKELSREFEGLALRIGMHTGRVTAGVIGIRKFTYDIWGDTVNVASRLESHGLPGAVHVSATVFERLKGRFSFEERGEVELKGVGTARTYLLRSPTG